MRRVPSHAVWCICLGVKLFTMSLVYSGSRIVSRSSKKWFGHVNNMDLSTARFSCLSSLETKKTKKTISSPFLLDSRDVLLYDEKRVFIGSCSCDSMSCFSFKTYKFCLKLIYYVLKTGCCFCIFIYWY